MDIRQLRYFLEIVEQGSISRAAERLNVAQPALSIHLRNLEAELGSQLLTRSRSGVLPSEAGLMLVRHARFMLSEQARAVEDIRHFGKEPSGDVRVGLPGTISEIIALPLIEATRDRYAGIRLTISEGMSGFVANWLRDGAVDLGILYASPNDPSLDSEKLLEEELVCIAACQRLSRATIKIADLAALPLVLPTRAHGLRQMIDAAAQVSGKSLSPEIEIDSYKNIKKLVARDLGVSILPQHAIAGDEDLTAIRLDPPLKRSAYLVRRANAPLPRTTQLIRETVREVAESLIAKGIWLGASAA